MKNQYALNHKWQCETKTLSLPEQSEQTRFVQSKQEEKKKPFANNMQMSILSSRKTNWFNEGLKKTD